MIVAGVVAVAISMGVWAHVATSPSRQVNVITNSQHQTTQISYKGQADKDALTLLKTHATVQTKHYSFGDQVTAINGVKGTGPKYWTFYINGTMAEVGAGDYKTKPGDTLMWKLQ